MEAKTNGEMIGRIGCWQPEGWIDFEIGWTLRCAYRGKGYVIEAARASVQYAFERLNGKDERQRCDQNEVKRLCLPLHRIVMRRFARD